MTADEQERAARLIAWIDDYLWAARPELDVEADTLVARLGPYRGVRRLPPPPTWSLAGDVAMAVGCRTGWQVVDNDVKSFDLLGGITPENGGITLEALAERCGE